MVWLRILALKTDVMPLVFAGILNTGNGLGIQHCSVSGGTHQILLPTYYIRELGGILYELFIPVKK